MTDTAITEIRSLGGSYASSAIEDIRRVVRNSSGQDGKIRCRMFPKGTNEEVWIEAVKGAAVDQDAL